ncbi:unnamed protein product [Lathyrus sativus]|nr:unnamed protein product [Lathyrus sativus]
MISGAAKVRSDVAGSEFKFAFAWTVEGLQWMIRRRHRGFADGNGDFWRQKWRRWRMKKISSSASPFLRFLIRDFYSCDFVNRFLCVVVKSLLANPLLLIAFHSLLINSIANSFPNSDLCDNDHDNVFPFEAF